MDLSSSPLVALAAGGGISPLVGDLGLCLVAAGLLAVAFVKARIPAIGKARGSSVHIVEHAPAIAATFEEVADAVFVGPAADRDTLEEAGLERAPVALLMTTNDDAITIYLTVYRRRLDPEPRIVKELD